MASKIMDPTLPAAGNRAPSKLQNFATALGILNTIGGLGTQAYGSFNATPASTTDMLRSGMNASGSNYNLFGVPSLTNGLSGMADLYKNKPFLGVTPTQSNLVNQN